MCKARVAHRSAPCKFFSRFFGDCNLENAIDFAVAADAELEAWHALHISLIFSKLSVLKDRKVFISIYT